MLLGLIAGLLTTLSPCVLPILPFILLGALDQHRWAPIALAAGLAATFTALGLVISGAGFASGISNDSIRAAAAVLMLVFGVVLLSTALQRRFAGASAALTGRLNGFLAHFEAHGLAGQFALGAMLGAVWTPCSGPTLGAAIGLAASRQTLAQAASVMLAFSIGACVPLLVIAYGSRQTLKSRRQALASLSRFAKPALGLVLVALAAAILSGADKTVETVLVASMSDWLITLTTRF